MGKPISIRWLPLTGITVQNRVKMVGFFEKKTLFLSETSESFSPLWTLNASFIAVFWALNSALQLQRV